MHLVVNEWLLDYCKPGTSPQDQGSLLAFLEKLYNSQSKIVIGSVTPFTIKFYRYYQKYRYDMECKHKFDRLNNLFRDLAKTIKVEPYETKGLTDEDIKDIHRKDHYLLELAVTVSDSIIVSVDIPLITNLSKGSIRVIHLHDYLRPDAGL